MKYKYLLGDSRGEAERLRRQARLWDPVAHDLFDRLKIRRGWRVLEVGPGRGSLHLELRRRVGKPLDAVERSPIFAENLRKISDSRIQECDLIDADLPRNHYDLIFSRWVFLFLPDPAAHVRKLAAALKPGGLLAIEDYHRETMALLPRPAEWHDFAIADKAFFASQGGNASIGGELPALFRRAGLDVVDIQPTIKTGRPGSDVWDWITTYFLGVMDRYAQFKPFNKAKSASLRRRWIAASRTNTATLVSPAVLDVVGRKRK